ncbi:single-stranded DNA-binding protein [Tunturiibacter psychrotolerans]|uniref:single-stranded DNA-binding protein n=1 Tax=Tunturiibacter psychrotolerans TaxID=3069686 RepID=UPI003D1F24CD
MALYENNVKLKGYVGKDAESYATKQQQIFAVFSIAVKSGYKDKQTDQWVNRTEWPGIGAFGKPSDIAKYLKKGDYVEIEGELRSSEREVEIVKDKKKTKIKIRDWEVRASSVKKLAKPSSGETLDTETITEGDAA